MNTKLFLQIYLHLYGSRRRVALVDFRKYTTCARESSKYTHRGIEMGKPVLYAKSDRFA